MLCSGIQYNIPHFQMNPQMVYKIFQTFCWDFSKMREKMRLGK